MSGDHSDEWRKTENTKQEKKKALKSAPTETSLCIHSAACVYVYVVPSHSLALRAQNLNVLFTLLYRMLPTLVRGSFHGEKKYIHE